MYFGLAEPLIDSSDSGITGMFIAREMPRTHDPLSRPNNPERYIYHRCLRSHAVAVRLDRYS